MHAADAVALQAQNDLTTAYNAAAGLAPTQNLTGQDLGGLTLTPGVYFFSSSAQLTGTLTLNDLGDPNAQFVFQIGSTLTTASNSSVVTINGGSMPGCNVFWQVGSSATLGTGTAFEGHILALTSITLNTGATILDGSALARNGAVTLDTNSFVPKPTADFDDDSDVDGIDFLTWQRNFGRQSSATFAQGDANDDGKVDGQISLDLEGAIWLCVCDSHCNTRTRQCIAPSCVRPDISGLSKNPLLRACARRGWGPSARDHRI